MKKYDFEYKYPLDEEDSETLQKELKVPYRIEFVVFLLEYEVEENNGFFRLNTLREDMLYAIDTDGIRVDLDKRSKFIVGDYIDNYLLYKVKYGHYSNKRWNMQ